MRALIGVSLVTPKPSAACLAVLSDSLFPEPLGYPLFDDPTDVGNLISSFSAFSKSSLNIWKFLIQVLLKPGLENFKYYFTSV